MSAPSIKGFYNFLNIHRPDVRLSDYQRTFVASLIDHRKLHFSGGCRSGRTFVADLVRDYFSIVYDMPMAGIEYEPQSTSTKPPIGLTPQYIHEWQRKQEILQAIERYIEDDKVIPEEWLEEFIELNQKRLDS